MFKKYVLFYPFISQFCELVYCQVLNLSAKINHLILQEFVPHGRTALARHPGQIYSRQNTSASENSLLYKLTNFGIKDESLLETKEEEQEWWCIREVYYRSEEG